MGSEEPPFETPVEQEYNRVIAEIADKRMECDAHLELLHQKAAGLSSQLSGGGNSSTIGSGDSAGNGGKISELFANLTSSFGNSTSSHSSETHNSSAGSPSSNGGVGTLWCRPCPLVRDCPVPPECPSPRECSPCPRTPDGSDLCQSASPPSVEGPVSFVADETSMAFVVGALASLLVLAVALLIGVLLRYLPIVVSGLLFIGLLALVWRLSSKYPEAARRLGARVWGALRSGVSAVVERLLGRRNSEVSERAVNLDKLCRGVIV
jgi:hypothetical protein